MGELRKDCLLDRWVLLSAVRARRPSDFKTRLIKNNKASCPFCPGHEHQTPNASYVVRKNSRWIIRSFPNKFNAVDNSPGNRGSSEFFNFMPALGYHEVLVETPDHNKSLADLPVDHISLVLDSYVKRILAFDSKYVFVFKNHGEEAATSIAHSHSQIVAYNQVPKLVESEVKAFKKFSFCPFCSIIRLEAKGPRFVSENSSFVAFTPFASRFPFEVWIFPKKHIKSLVDLTDFSALASILKHVLLKLRTINASYNFFVHNAPSKSDFHFHIEITPRLSKLGGFELGTDTFINVVSPEEAARFYRK